MADFSVTPSQIREYAELSHDHNVLHLDATVAASSPLGRVVPHGFLLLGDALTAMQQLVGPPWSLSVTFKSPGFLDEPMHTAFGELADGKSFEVVHVGGDVLAFGEIRVGTVT